MWFVFHVTLPSLFTVRVPLGITPAHPNVSFSDAIPVALNPAESEQKVELEPLAGATTISPSAAMVFAPAMSSSPVCVRAKPSFTIG